MHCMYLTGSTDFGRLTINDIKTVFIQYNKFMTVCTNCTHILKSAVLSSLCGICCVFKYLTCAHACECVWGGKGVWVCGCMCVWGEVVCLSVYIHLCVCVCVWGGCLCTYICVYVCVYVCNVNIHSIFRIFVEMQSLVSAHANRYFILPEDRSTLGPFFCIIFLYGTSTNHKLVF